jgi:hypothetical protein
MANKLNLDRSQRLDITCKRNDTFKMNLELKDDDGVAIDLNATAGVSSTNPLYAFKMQVRHMDTHDDTGAYDEDANPAVLEGYLISIFATIINSAGSDTRTGSSAPTINTNLAEFKIPHGSMTLASGVYVYDIQRHLIETAPSYSDPASDSINGATPAEVETILYGVFTVNEDVTLI